MTKRLLEGLALILAVAAVARAVWVVLGPLLPGLASALGLLAIGAFVLRRH